MLTMHSHSDPARAAAYFKEHVVSESKAASYYAPDDAKPGTVPGIYFGTGAALLSLTGQPTEQEIQRLFDNRNPFTGEPLTQRRKDNAKSAYDLTFSAPKSVSIMGLVMNDPRVIEAHVRAVMTVLVQVEKAAMVRVRANGENTNRVTGCLLSALFLHFSSRELDPQIHHHCLAINASYDDIEACWKALQVFGIYKQSGLLTAIYRSALAKELHALGYPTESNEKGVVEIAGVSRDVIDLFSKRHSQIDRIAAQRGEADNPELRAGIAHKYRKAKDSSMSIDELREGWLAQLSPEGQTKLEVIKAAATGPLKQENVSAQQALSQAALHLFERRSVVTCSELYKEALTLAPGQTDIAALEAALEQERLKTDNPAFVFAGDEVTTPAAIDAEKEMVAMVNDSVGTCSPLNSSFVPCYAPALDHEQRDAVTFLLNCKDRFASLHGPAGTGKTTTLSELHTGLRAAGHSVLLCGPSANAVKVLKKDGFFDAQTLQRFLVDREMQEGMGGGVVVVDEAGLVSVEQMGNLFQLALKHDFRVVLSGDSRQHTSVERGDALRILESHSKLARTAISTIWRQEHEAYRAVVHALKNGNTLTGFAALDDLHWVKELDNEDRYAAIAADFLDARTHHKSALIVCATWGESDVVTASVRAALQKDGLLSTTEHVTDALAPINWTEEHRGQAHRYQPGQLIVFNRKSHLFPRGEHLTVTGVDGKFVVVKNALGVNYLLQPRKEAKRISVFSPKSIAIAPDEQLLIRRNGTSGSGSKLTNGELVEVKEVAPSGLITLKDGRTIPADFRHLTHGYAVSSQASQGKTVDRVLVAIDAVSATSAATQATLYVAASRGRQRCTIYTDDKEVLLGAFQRNSDRKAALEFFQQTNTHETIASKPTNTRSSIPAVRSEATPQPGLDHPHLPQLERGGVDPLQLAQRLHSLPPHPRTGSPKQSGVRRPGGNGPELSNPDYRPQAEPELHASLNF